MGRGLSRSRGGRRCEIGEEVLAREPQGRMNDALAKVFERSVKISRPFCGLR